MKRFTVILLCAWVVWYRAENPSGLLLWTPFSAWQTRDACARERLTAYRERGLPAPSVGFASRQEAASILEQLRAEGEPTKTERFECFPDTIDPRGPKR